MSSFEELLRLAEKNSKEFDKKVEKIETNLQQKAIENNKNQLETEKLQKSLNNHYKTFSKPLLNPKIISKKTILKSNKPQKKRSINHEELMKIAASNTEEVIAGKKSIESIQVPKIIKKTSNPVTKSIIEKPKQLKKPTFQPESKPELKLKTKSISNKHNYSDEIKKLFPSRFGNAFNDDFDDDDMEVGYSQLTKEENRTNRIAKKEDQIELERLKKQRFY
jgi:hypothetical protein